LNEPESAVNNQSCEKESRWGCATNRKGRNCGRRKMEVYQKTAALRGGGGLTVEQSKAMPLPHPINTQPQASFDQGSAQPLL